MKSNFSILLFAASTLGMLAACSPADDADTMHADHDAHETHSDHDGHGNEHAEHGGEAHGSEAHEDVVELSAAEARDAGIVLSEAQTSLFQETLSLPAELRFDADRVAEVSPPVSGRVIRLFASEGEHVQRGDTIAIISSREIADLKAGFLKARASEKLAAQALQREETLFEDRITSEADLLTARAAFSEAEAEREAVENQLHAFGITHAELDGLDSAPDGSLANTPIHAPISGVVVARKATLGAAVTAEDASASALFTIVDGSVLWADIAVYKQDTGAIREGAAVTLQSQNGQTLAEGEVLMLLPVIEETSRTATARMIVENPDGDLRPGQFVTAEVAAGTSDPVLQISANAVVEVEGRTSVFVPNDHGFEPVPVRTGRTSSGRIVITDGLSPGDRFVSEGAFTLKAQLEKDAFGDGHVH
tara:strand:- start:4734 stop:5996 length:1263 start_codon:yes stop_codon:yes gene_type:complete